MSVFGVLVIEVSLNVEVPGFIRNCSIVGLVI